MPERGRRDRHAEPPLADAVRERRECRERLERHTASLLACVREVIAHPAGIENVELAGTSPHRVEDRPVKAADPVAETRKPIGPGRLRCSLIGAGSHDVPPAAKTIERYHRIDASRRLHRHPRR